MAQHYPNPHDVAVPPTTPYPTARLRTILHRDGQIVPLLVRRTEAGGWIAADRYQGERVLALRELGWDTILVEDEWEPDDL